MAGWNYACPHYGSADVSLRFLRAWCEKYDCFLALEWQEDKSIKWMLISEDMTEFGGSHLEPPDCEPTIMIEAKGKTDSEALCKLVLELMENQGE
jgi:hypothetical protein